MSFNKRAIAIDRQTYLLLGWENNIVVCCLYQLKLHRILGLSTALNQVNRDRLGVRLKRNSSIYLDIQIAPILGGSSNLLASNLTFTNVKRCKTWGSSRSFFGS